MLLLCSKPDTVSVVFPGPAAVTTPARLTRTTLWSFEAHCSTSGFTARLFCDGTMTCSVSISPATTSAAMPHEP